MSSTRYDLRTISDELLMAYADGELDDRAAQELGRAIERDPALAARLKVFRVTGRSLAPHFDAVLVSEPPAAMVAAILNAPIRDRRPAPRGSIAVVAGRLFGALGLGPSPWPALAGLGLGLMVGAVATVSGLGTRTDEALVAEQGGQLVASGALARTLESQTMQASHAESVQVVSTFKAETGQWCRLYQAAAHSGLACRLSMGQWQIVEIGASLPNGSMDSTTPSQGGGAQAVDELASAMMASSAALDAEAEAALIARGWEAQ
jgi:hypothetical protein